MNLDLISIYDARTQPDTAHMNTFIVEQTKGTENPPSISFIADKVERALPQAQTQTLKGAGHVPQITHPEQYAEVVTSFIRNAPVANR